MKKIKVQGEITASSYKKLVEKMRKLNRAGLWKVLDHYLFHVMEEHHANELLQILDSFGSSNNKSLTEDGKNQIQAAVTDSTLNNFRLKMSTELTPEDLRRSSDFLDIMYDDNYFTYLTPEVVQANAKALVTYATANNLPVQPHWENLAKGDEE